MHLPLRWHLRCRGGGCKKVEPPQKWGSCCSHVLRRVTARRNKTLWNISSCRPIQMNHGWKNNTVMQILDPRVCHSFCYCGGCGVCLRSLCCYCCCCCFVAVAHDFGMVEIRSIWSAICSGFVLLCWDRCCWIMENCSTAKHNRRKSLTGISTIF